MLSSNQMLIQPQFSPAENKRNVWVATIPHSTEQEDIFKPEFFSNVAAQLTVGDRIECVAEDGTYFIEVYVIAVAEKTQTKNANWANVVELRNIDLVRREDKNLKLPVGFFAQYRGGAKWCVMRKGTEDGADTMIIDKQLSRADAIREFEKMKNKLVA